MTVIVKHKAGPTIEGDLVRLDRFVERHSVIGATEIMSHDSVLLTPEDAMRLARAIRHPAEESGLFEDARTGRFALDADYVPCESFDFHWYRDSGPDAYDSLSDTGWPEAWADEIERAAREAMG